MESMKEEPSNQNIDIFVECKNSSWMLSEEVLDNLHVFPRWVNVIEGLFAIKSSGSLFQCSILGLNEEEPQEHEFGCQRADKYQLHLR